MTGKTAPQSGGTSFVDANAETIERAAQEIQASLPAAHGMHRRLCGALRNDACMSDGQMALIAFLAGFLLTAKNSGIQQAAHNLHVIACALAQFSDDELQLYRSDDAYRRSR